MKRILLFNGLFALLVFLLTASNASAATIDPPEDQIREDTKKVTITFPGMPDGDYRVCLSSRDIECQPASTRGAWKTVTASNNQVVINVCGDGQDLLKIVSNECSDSDFFHEDKTYRVQLWSTDLYNTRKFDEIRFTITPIAPSYSFEPLNPSPGDSLKAIVRGRRAGGDSRNNYVFRISEQNGTKVTEACFTVDSEATIAPPSQSEDPSLLTPKEQGEATLPPQPAGTYLLSIREQVDESTTTCNGRDDWAYIQRSVVIAVGGGRLLDDETKSQDEYIARDVDPDAPPPPCAGPLVNGVCPAVKTAIGDIKTDPAGFIDTIFKLLLGVAGGIAVVLIIISGYKLMASQGNPEKVQGAREMLTSAIVGLLFIIFSFVILQVIGVDILKIPGFSK